MPEMPDFEAIMQMAQNAQNELQRAQDTLDKVEVEGASGGGMVKIRATAKGRILSVDIDESLLAPSEKAMLEDLVAAAINDARGKADAAAATEMEKMLNGTFDARKALIEGNVELSGDLTVLNWGGGEYWLMGSYYLREFHMRWFESHAAEGITVTDLSDTMSGFLLTTVQRLGLDAVRALPGLVTVAIILAVARFLVRLAGAWFMAVEQGQAQPRWLHPDTAQPTRRLVTGSPARARTRRSPRGRCTARR